MLLSLLNAIDFAEALFAFLKLDDLMSK